MGSKAAEFGKLIGFLVVDREGPSKLYKALAQGLLFRRRTGGVLVQLLSAGAALGAWAAAACAKQERLTW